MKAKVRFKIKSKPLILNVLIEKATAATAMPFCTFKVMNNFSLKVNFSRPKENWIAMNLITIYIKNKAKEVIMNFTENGILITSPMRMKTRISREFEKIDEKSWSLIFWRRYTFPNNNPNAVTDNTPLPSRFSAKMYAISAAVIIARGDKTREYFFFMKRSDIRPTKIPAPIPATNCWRKGRIWSINFDSATSFSTVVMNSKIMNGNNTVIGVFIKASTLKNSETLDEVHLIMESTAAGEVPDINELNNRRSSIDSTSSAKLRINVKNNRLNNKKTKDSSTALGDNFANLLNLNLDEESNTIITRARMLIEDRNSAGNETRRLLL